MFNEWTVHVMLEGDFGASYTDADNSQVLPTDTMKNTVYFVARGSKAETIEAFAMELGDYLLDNHAQIATVSVEVEEKAWERMIVDGAPEATTFKLGGPELQTVRAERTRGGAWKVTSGIDGLTILKTTKSAFTGYGKDKLTTLQPATDRILGTRATVEWEYTSAAPDFAQVRERVVAALLKDIRRAQQHERAAYAVRHGKRSARSRAGDCAHSSFHAQSASSAGQFRAVRAGQS